VRIVHTTEAVVEAHDLLGKTDPSLMDILARVSIKSITVEYYAGTTETFDKGIYVVAQRGAEDEMRQLARELQVED
jgi:hypothetical protein